MRTPEHPGLYDANTSPPALSGTRCGSCGATFFPPLAIGCEVCGSPDLDNVSLAAVGRLHSFATVHLYRGKGIEAPFTIGEVVLDDGPVVRVTMLANDGFQIGDRVAAEWTVRSRDESGQEIVEPRFRRAE